MAATTMRAMILEKVNEPLKVRKVPVPSPGEGQVLIKVNTCAVCRTDLHITDGDLPNPKLPLIPGHEIIGRIVRCGKNTTRFRVGDRVGVPWLGHTCGKCTYCLRHQENLCNNARFTGYTMDGGFAEYTLAYENYCFAVPDFYDDAHAAPLMCAGLIGYRTYRMTGEHVKNLGIYGFGAAAHLIAQVANWQEKRVFAFTRPGDREAQRFALSHGVFWAGDSTQRPPEKLDAAMIFAPVGSLLVEALKAVDKGGVVISGGIHMSDIPSFPYSLLWEERTVRSVANLQRQDGEEFLRIAPQVPVKTEVELFDLTAANEALHRLRTGNISGAAVLKCQNYD